MLKDRPRISQYVLALFVGITFAFGHADVADAKTPDLEAQQASSCMSILMEAAGKAGIPGSVVDSTDNGHFDCSVSFDHMDQDNRFLERSMLFLSDSGDFAEEPCGNPPTGCKQSAFHGYPAAYFAFGDRDAGNTLSWNMPRGGHHYRLGVHVRFSGVGPEAYAEALWSVAEDRLPLSGFPSGGAENPVSPNDPSIQTEAPADTGIPLPIAMGNVAVPLAGAVAGTLLALGLSGLSSASSAASSAGSVTSSRFGDMNEQGMVWSDRPWDEAGPGYVTRDEYERTRTLRSKGYEWTKDGWQTPDERQQSQQWDAKDRDAVKRADGDWKAKQDDQRKQLEIEQQKERTRLIESYLPPDTPPPAPAPTGQESPWQFDPSLEAGGSGDLGTGTIDPNVGGSVTVYKNAYYDMPDRKDDITLFGWDIGNYKCDVQVGKVQAGAGASINPDKPESQQVGLGGSVSAIQLTGEAVLGNKYLGLTFDSTVEGPKGEAFVGYKDGGAGGALGASAGSVDVGLGVNAGAVTVSGRVGLNAGMEFSLKLGTQGEVKFGPFKLGYSLGWAKTGT